MDGIHDLGGMQGFGPVVRDEATFHEAWERRVFGIALASSLANIDAFRHAVERLDPVTYLTAGYFGRWLAALERLVAEDDARVRNGSPLARRTVERVPRFQVGAAVRVRDLRTDGHTRLPGYARGRRGRVERVHPAFVLPDTNAHGRGEDPQYVYCVRFAGSEIWGGTAEPGTCVHVDLFEPYLEPESEAS
jgi:nitrile hydratase